MTLREGEGNNDADKGRGKIAAQPTPQPQSKLSVGFPHKKQSTGKNGKQMAFALDVDLDGQKRKEQKHPATKQCPAGTDPLDADDGENRRNGKE